MIDRRDFLGRAMFALLAQTIVARRVVAANTSRQLAAWIRAHDDLARKLHRGELTGPRWMRSVEELSSHVELNELLRAIDFAKLEREFRFTSDGGTKQVIRIQHPDDPARRLMIGAAIFGLEKKKAITPHGHRYMVSAHLVIDGKLHVRNFDRIGDEDSHLILRPTVDGTIARGACSTMSTERNNIHWFTALTSRAFTLDVVASDLVPGKPSYAIDLVDPRGATRLANGDLRARRIQWKESVALYGAE